MAQLMSIKRNVEMCPGQVSVPAIYHVSQGDKGTRIILGLVNNSANYTIPEGTTATIRGHRADGTLFTEITADVETTEVKFNLTEDMSAVPGRAECEAVLASGSANIIGTANFIIDVEKSPASIGSVTPGTDAATTWLIDKLENEPLNSLNGESVVDAINDSFGSGLTEDIKTALLACFEKVAWIDEDGQDYYDALYNALYPPAPPATLTSITCVYTQSGTVSDTDTLDSLKSDLVVTATYSDSTTRTLSDSEYTLSGTLEVGTSTIVVSYGGKTDTFDVDVTDQIISVGIRSADILVTGLTKESTNRATTNMISVTGGSSITVTSSAFYFRLLQYDINKNYLPNATDIGDLSALTATGTLDASCAYIRVLMKKPDNSNFTEQELLASTLTINDVSRSLTRSTEENGIAILKVTKRGVSSTTGDYTESSIRVSTDSIPIKHASGNCVITTTSGEGLKLWSYKADSSLNRGVGTFGTTSVTIDISNVEYSLIITFKKVDDSEFTDADMLSITGTINGVPYVVEEAA